MKYGCITRNIFPLFNFIVIDPIVVILSIFLLKIKPLKSIVIVISNMLILLIIELISVFTCMSICKINSETFVNSWKYLTFALIIQYTLIFVLIKAAAILL